MENESSETLRILESLTRSIRNIEENRSRTPNQNPKRLAGAGGSYAATLRKNPQHRYSNSLKDIERRLQESEAYLHQHAAFLEKRQKVKQSQDTEKILMQLQTRGLELFQLEKKLTSKEDSVNQTLIEVSQKEQKISNEKYALKAKEKELNQLKNFYEKELNHIQKKQQRNICEDLVKEVVYKAFGEIYRRDEVMLLNRKQACQIAYDKMKKSIDQVEDLKKKLQQEALTVIDTKYKLEQEEKEIHSTQSQIKTQSKLARQGKSEQLLRKREEMLRIKEQAFNEKLKQLQSKEQELKGSLTQRTPKSKSPVRVSKSPASISKSPVRENSLRKKEIELKDREKQIKLKEEKLNQEIQSLETRKKEVSQQWSSLITRMDNIRKLENKAESAKAQVSEQQSEFIKFKQEEEARLSTWEASLRNQEAALQSRKKQLQQREQELKTREEELKTKEEEPRIQSEEIYDSLASDFGDFTEKYQKRQQSRLKNYEELNKEKREISEKLSSILSELG